jgi:hypothetical protein
MLTGIRAAHHHHHRSLEVVQVIQDVPPVNTHLDHTDLAAQVAVQVLKLLSTP